MIVVADTSPLNYLLLIEGESVLPKLYDRVVLPEAVVREMRHPLAPRAVSAWAESFPAWLEVSAIAVEKDPSLAYLGDGEREAIALAQVISPERLLMDDPEGPNRGETPRNKHDRNARNSSCRGPGTTTACNGRL